MDGILSSSGALTAFGTIWPARYIKLSGTSVGLQRLNVFMFRVHQTFFSHEHVANVEALENI